MRLCRFDGGSSLFGPTYVGHCFGALVWSCPAPCRNTTVMALSLNACVVLAPGYIFRSFCIDNLRIAMNLNPNPKRFVSYQQLQTTKEPSHAG